MKTTSETILFFGSGPVAAKSLALLEQGFTIEAVITKPRAEHHKGPVPVIETAADLHLPVLTADGKESLQALFGTKTIKSKVAVLIDFGLIIPQSVIDYFPLGIVNSHFSLLPEWRGADPITFAILNGQEETGISLMLLVAALDEGPLLAQAPLRIASSATTPTLTNDLIDLSNKTLHAILPKYLAGSLHPYPQRQDIDATYSRKLTKEDGIIDWHKSATQLEREVRAFMDWPQSRARIGQIEAITTESHVIKQSGKPGTVKLIGNELITFCAHDALAIDRLKPIGKREMSSQAFLAGYKDKLALT